MNLYIWKQIDNLTDNWHDRGGAVVIAETEDGAYAKLPEANPDAPRTRTPADAVFCLVDGLPLETPEQSVFIFPDAGCC